MFNRKLLSLRKLKAQSTIAQSDFIYKEADTRMAERLDMMQRNFELALYIGNLGDTELQEHPKITTLQHLQSHHDLPLKENQFDLIICSMNMHHINDIPAYLYHIKSILRQDGLLLAIMPGPHSLQELRTSLAAAEIELYGGVTPKISPFPDVRDAGSLLQQAGFALPVIDSDIVSILYPHTRNLLQDLKNTGETNIMTAQRKGLSNKHLFTLTEKIYHQKYAQTPENPADTAPEIPATVEFITMTAWKPDKSQQQPAKRGSGQVSFAAIAATD